MKMKIAGGAKDIFKSKRIRLRRADHTGDTILADIDTAADTGIEVLQDELTAFLDDCVQQFGQCPPVWAGRISPDSTELKWGKLDLDGDLSDVAEVLVHYPIRGG